MSIYRVRKELNYTVVSNTIAQNAGLSWEARGVMLYLLSKPDGWEVSEADLTKQGGAGRDKVRRVLNELKAAGHFRRIRQRNPDGTYRFSTEIHERPVTENPHMDEPCASTDGLSTYGLPVTGEPSTDNPTLISTEESNTEESNTDSDSTGSPLSDDPTGPMLDIWNEVAGTAGTVKATRMTEPRRRALKARLKDTFGGSMDQWRAYCLRIGQSTFLRGKAPVRGASSQPFRASLDWVLKPANMTKILEGNYDDQQAPANEFVEP